MEYITDLVLIFFTYSLVGWCIEVTLKFFQYHRFINRGFLIGPCLPIYGSGCALITVAMDGLVLLARSELSYGTVFAVSFFLCGLLEYTVSYVLEKRFHARWWDYSKKPMNLNGRVWIGNLILFGLGGLIVVKLVNPVLLGALKGIDLRVRYYVAGGLLAVFVADYIVSHFVLKLVKDSVEKSEADNTEAISREVLRTMTDRNLFAKRFANAYPDVIYRTERVKARMEAIKAQTEKFRREVEQQISSAIEAKVPLRYGKVDDLLSEYFEISGKTAGIDLEYGSFEEIVNQSFGKDSVNMLDQKIYADMESAFAMIPSKYKVDLRITLKDLGGHTLDEVKHIIESNLALRAYGLGLRRFRKTWLHVLTAAIGVGILVASYFLSDKGHPKIVYDVVNIAGTLFIWETVSSMFLSDSYERMELSRLVTNVRRMTVIGPDGKEAELDFLNHR